MHTDTDSTSAKLANACTPVDLGIDTENVAPVTLPELSYHSAVARADTETVAPCSLTKLLPS